MDIQQAEIYFNKYFPQDDKNNGVIREIKKEIEEVKQTTNLEAKHSTLFNLRNKHETNLNTLTKTLNFLSLRGFSPNKEETIDKYSKQVDRLKKLEEETWNKLSQIKSQNQKERRDKENQLKTSHCAYCKNKPPTTHYIYSEKNKILKPRKRNASLFNEWLFCSEAHFDKWHKKNYFCCAECNKERYDGKYKRSKSKKDGQKLCSDNCFYTHYAESCDNCLEKCVSSYQNKATGYAQTYYSDAENKTGTLCSKCHQEQLKEEREERKKDREWDETCKRLDKHMDDLVDGMVEIAKGKDEEDSNVDDSDNSPVSNNNNQRERESKPLTKSNNYVPKSCN